MKRNIFFTLTALVSTLFFLTTSAGATGIDVKKMTPTELDTMFFDEEYGGYYDSELGGYIEMFSVEDGVVTKMNMEDYIQRQLSVPNITKEDGELNEKFYGYATRWPTNPILPHAPQLTTRYVEEGNYETIQFGSVASPTYVNQGPGDDTQTLEYSYSKGHNFSIDLTGAEARSVVGNVSYTFNSSASVKSSGTMTVQAGFKGYFRFDPKVRVSYGELNHYNQGYFTHSESVRTYYPVETATGVLAGELAAIKIPIE